MARSRKRTGNKTFPKRATLWLPFDVSLSMTTAGSIVESGDLLGNYFGQTGAEIPVGATVGPIRGRWVLEPQALATFDGSGQVEAVLQLLKEGGRAVSPVPGVDIIDAMWYGQAFFEGRIVEISAGVFNQQQHSMPFETRAMRKITGNGQILVVSAVDETNTNYDIRVLGNIFVRLP